MLIQLRIFQMWFERQSIWSLIALIVLLNLLSDCSAVVFT